ncbi:MAG: GspH/FimT family pseudopilin [Granulosicoccus sp.]
MLHTFRGSLRGFTLVELLVTLAVAAILLGVAAPNFRNAIQDSQQNSCIYDLIGAMQYARSEAIKQSSRISVCALADDGSCGSNWNNSWQVFIDTGATIGAIDPGETVLRTGCSLPSDLTVSTLARQRNNGSSETARGFVRFGPRGTSNWRGGGTFLFCDSRGIDNAVGINLSISGDIRRARRDGDDNLINAFGENAACIPITDS